MGPCPHLWLLHAKQRILVQSTSLYGYQTSLVVLCMQNGVIYTRMTSLHGFQPSSVLFCLQNSDFKTRLTSLYGSQSSSVVLSTHNSVLSTRIKRLYGFQPSPVVLCMQTATLALELLVSIVPCPHLRFLHANQRLLEQNNRSLCIPDLTCDFLHAKQRG